MTTPPNSKPLELPGPVAFVMGGGGTLGASQVGMLQALSKHDIAPDLIVGTSVGALNGAFLAANPNDGVEQLAEIWPKMTKDQIFPESPWQSLRTLGSEKTHLFSNDGLASFIDDHLHVSDIGDLKVPFTAVATDVDTGQPVTLDSGPVKSALLASAAMPGAFPAVERDGHLLYDGGMVAKVPMGQALARGAATLVLLDCAFPGQPAPRPTNLLKVLDWSSTLTQNSQAGVALQFVPDEIAVLYLPGPPRSRFSHLELDHTDELISGAYSASSGYLEAAEADPDLVYRHEPPVRPPETGETAHKADSSAGS